MRLKSAFLVLLWLAEAAIVYCPEIDTRNQNEHECRLPDIIDGLMFDSAEGTWTIDDGFLRGHQLQDILDCARDGQTIVLNVSKLIAPTRSLVIRKSFVIRPYQTLESNNKVTLTCPQDDSLMLIENTNVLLENLIIKGCSFREGAAFNSIIRLKCDATADEAFAVNLLNVDFSNNRSPGGSTGIHLENPSCILISMKGVAFQNSDLLHGSMLTHKDDLNKVVALWNASDTLLEIDSSSKLNDGDGTIVFALPVLEAGNYSMVLKVSEVNNRNVTLNLKARNCSTNEFLGDSGKRCTECEEDQCNNRVENYGNEICPKHANCSRNYVLPVSGYWNSFPCSTHVQKCLNRDACQGSKKYAAKEIIQAVDSATCSLAKDMTKKYQDGQCDEGHQGLLCNACKNDYGRIDLFECVPCHNSFLILFSMFISSFLLIYSVWEHIAANLELIKTRRMQRLDRPSIEERETCLQQALQMMEHSEEYITKAQNAKEKFVIVLQITLNFLQVLGPCLLIHREWSSFLPKVLTASNWINLNVSPVYKFSFECLLPTQGKTPRSVLSTILALFVPLMVIGIFCTYWLYDTVKLRKPWKQFVKRCILSFISVLYVCCYSLVNMSVSTFYCVKVFDGVSLNGKDAFDSYWGVDTSVRCGEGNHNILRYWIGLPMSLFLGVCGSIVCFVLIVARERGALHLEWIHETLHVLFIGFRPGKEEWDFYCQMRKISVAGGVPYVYIIGSLWQGVVMTLILAFFTVWHLRHRPYRTDLGNLNSLEGTSLFVCTATAGISTILASQRVSSAVVKAALVAIVFVINAVNIIVYGYHLVTNKFVEIKYTLLLRGVVNEDDNILVVLLKYWQKKRKRIRTLLGKVATSISSTFERSRSEIAGSSSSSLLPSSSDT